MTRIFWVPLRVGPGWRETVTHPGYLGIVQGWGTGLPVPWHLVTAGLTERLGCLRFDSSDSPLWSVEP